MSKKTLVCMGAVAPLLFASQALEGKDVFIEGKAGYFFPISDRFRDIYGTGGVYGGEISWLMWKHLYGWGSASYFHKSGTSRGGAGGHSTEVTLVPLAFGLKYLFPYKWMDFYLGLGPTFTHVKFEDNSPFVIRHSEKWGYGVTGKAGVLLNFKKHFFLDLFTDYSYLKVHFHETHGGRVVRHRADLSDWSIGAGLGLRWGRPEKKERKKEEPAPVKEVTKKPSWLKNRNPNA